MDSILRRFQSIFRFTLTISLTTTLLVACVQVNANDTSISGNNSSVDNFDAFVGLWDMSENNNGTVNVRYVEIFKDGSSVGWDYFGDDHDRGADCYYKKPWTDQLTKVREDIYVNSKGIEFNISVSDDVLIFNPLDSAIAKLTDGALKLRLIDDLASTAFNLCPEDFEPISGVWDSTEIVNGVADIKYMVINTQGQMVEWDYQGDDLDAGDNCYIENDREQLVNRRGFFHMKAEELIVNISVIDDELYFSPVDLRGKPKLNLSITFPAANNIKIENIKPCDAG